MLTLPLALADLLVSSSSSLTPLHSGLHCFLVRRPSCFESPQQVHLAVNAGLLVSRLYTSRDRDVSVYILYGYNHKSTDPSSVFKKIKTISRKPLSLREILSATMQLDSPQHAQRPPWRHGNVFSRRSRRVGHLVRCLRSCFGKFSIRTG